MRRQRTTKNGAPSVTTPGQGSMAGGDGTADGITQKSDDEKRRKNGRGGEKPHCG
jgi:hypothetical protein